MYHLDPRSHLIRQGRRAPAHSPNFNARRWRASAEGLALTNAPKKALAKVAKGDGVHSRPSLPVDTSVGRLQALRGVTNRQAAEMLGLSTLSVKALRAVAKARGLKGYSKANKSALLAMLA